jgi:hypothetical protein
VTVETATPKNPVIHSPLIRFRKRANCQNCKLHDACKVDKLLELRCILALIADSQHNTMQLNAIRGQ